MADIARRSRRRILQQGRKEDLQRENATRRHTQRQKPCLAVATFASRLGSDRRAAVYHNQILAQRGQYELNTTAYN